jgi:hypothetical protein
MPVLQEPTAAERREAAAKGHALPDGSFPVRNRVELKAAIKLNGNSKTYPRSRVRKHIIRRAKALGLLPLVPDDWDEKPGDGAAEDSAEGDSATQEELVLDAPLVLAQQDEQLGVLKSEDGRMPTLCLEDVGLPVVLQEAAPDNGGVMRVRCPFFVGNSVSRAKGFPKPIYWPEAILAEIVSAGNAQIAAAKQPLTSYARHNHATSGDDLPVGKVVELERDGRIGWATHELYDVVPHGVNLQKLIRNKAINAASLRTNRYKFGEAKVDGEDMLVAEKLVLDGIDWAPDGPAQETFGIEVLHQEAVLEQSPPAPPPHPQKRSKRNLPVANTTTEPQPLTLEEVRACPDIVQEIEKPWREKVDSLTQENEELRKRDALRLRDMRIAEIAADTPNPEEFRGKLTVLCDEEKVVDANGVNTILAPLLMQEMRRLKDNPPAPKKTTREELAELFRPGGSGTVHQEDPNATPPPKPETKTVTQGRAPVLTVGGLELPEDF